MLIIFDLDDTLIETFRHLQPFVQKQVHEILAQSVPERQVPLLWEMFKRLDDTAQSFKHCVEEFCEINELDPKVMQKLKQLKASNCIDRICVTPTDGAIEVLSKLSMHHTLALVTAGDEAFQYKKLQAAEIPENLFSTIYVCESFQKKFCYQKCLEEFNAQPKEALVCADRLLVDLIPAKQLGMKTVHYLNGRGNNYFGPTTFVDFSIRQLSQIHDIVEQLERFIAEGQLV